MKVTKVWQNKVFEAAVSALTIQNDCGLVYCGSDEKSNTPDSSAPRDLAKRLCSQTGQEREAYTVPDAAGGARHLSLQHRNSSRLLFCCLGDQSAIECCLRPILPEPTPCEVRERASPHSCPDLAINIAKNLPESLQFSGRDRQNTLSGPSSPSKASGEALQLNKLATSPSSPHTQVSLHQMKTPQKQANVAESQQDSCSSPISTPATQDASQEELLQLMPRIHVALLAPCGSMWYTGSLGAQDAAIRVWSCRTKLLLHTLAGHTAPVLSLAFTQKGQVLLSGSHDRTVRVWRTSDGSCIKVLRGHQGGVRAVVGSPDGALCYSSAADGAIKVWHIDKGLSMRSLQGRQADLTWVQHMVVSDDGDLLVAGSNGPFGGSRIKVFYVRRGATGKLAGSCLATFSHLEPQQPGSITALALSHDGTQLFSGASDGTVAAWRLETKLYEASEAHGGTANVSRHEL